jgi:hypothetical protein
MDNDICCDICGYPATKDDDLDSNDQRDITMDNDGLWICSNCEAKLANKPEGDFYEDDCELDDEIRSLIGKSAGAICRTLGLPYEPPYQVIMDAASKIAYDEDRYMSTWAFVAQWVDGATIWQSPDRTAKALVHEDGKVRFEPRR